MNLKKSNNRIERCTKELEKFFNKFETIKKTLSEEINNIKQMQMNLIEEHEVELELLKIKHYDEEKDLNYSLTEADNNLKRVMRLLK